MPSSSGSLTKSLIGAGAPPVAPIEENIPLLRKSLVEKFKDVFDKNRIPFPAMKGKELHIHLINKDIEPYAAHTPLSIAYHLEHAGNELLKSWRTRGITPVQVGEPVN